MEINNSMVDLMSFFSTPDRPVKAPEFREFWGSLSDTEKAWYKKQPLS